MKSPRFDAIVQIGIVVADVDEAIRHYANLLGIRDWNINQVDSDKGDGRDFRSAEGEISVKAKIAWTNIGDIELELIEPQDRTSTYAEFLRNSGPGVHHVMLNTGGFDRDVTALRDSGLRTLLSGELQATKFQLFDSRAELGTIIELAEGGALLPDESIVVDDRRSTPNSKF